ncbi:TPA: phosphoribosylformylglycinamidine cyclo-ligase [bacterium]|nr:phosphoribosylformylglycinamidine cyclo-ligase [bacterium]
MKYLNAGVDIDRGDKFVSQIKEKLSFRKGKLEGIGHFSGFFQLDFSSFKEPVLASSCDGVGTKVKIAQVLNIHYPIGIDLVAMCVNDIVAVGATPLFLLDYLAFGKLDLDVANRLIDGIIDGCKEANCTLLGGETAEMPDVYGEGEYDIAGFCVGVVEKEKIITGEKIKKDDFVIGIPSSGIHSNGFSLVRKVIKELSEELLTPTRIYVKDFLKIKDFEIHGIAHITGGGIIENVKRILPDGLRAVIDKKTWKVPEVFIRIIKEGNIPEEEMFRIFNMGIGMIIITNDVNILEEFPLIIGRIEEGEKEVDLI